MIEGNYSMLKVDGIYDTFEKVLRAYVFCDVFKSFAHIVFSVFFSSCNAFACVFFFSGFLKCWPSISS